jgi:hypothetical protein
VRDTDIIRALYAHFSGGLGKLRRITASGLHHKAKKYRIPLHLSRCKQTIQEYVCLRLSSKHLLHGAAASS